jgi:hypothetical protein
VAYGRVAGQVLLEHSWSKNLRDEAHSGVAFEFGPVGDGDACGLLPAVILRKDALVADV